ncbi:hypothetical protein EUGRSUZ_D00488 [Eucalyptus grandis]|uniref:Uncharacterized protein n=2 Tax=Eucalyptus grandis TaxID=71139 RepID=A0ACC3L2Z2_EUCGR|nr:hypothetical protein EUGRSUZ_D00488 [Eucalyptus grandis]
MEMSLNYGKGHSNENKTMLVHNQEYPNCARNVSGGNPQMDKWKKIVVVFINLSDGHALGSSGTFNGHTDIKPGTHSIFLASLYDGHRMYYYLRVLR